MSGEMIQAGCHAKSGPKREAAQSVGRSKAVGYLSGVRVGYARVYQHRIDSELDGAPDVRLKLIADHDHALVAWAAWIDFRRSEGSDVGTV